jgi:formate-dependent nitrite reductase cytochrome c552 subunit
LSEKETPRLVSVACESCHGPGEKHVLAEQGTDAKVQETLRKALRLPVENGVAKKQCLTCHDGDNSPHFNFDTYWKKIEHKSEP